MSRTEREKGRRGERELQLILQEQLGAIYGTDLDRNWNQREGGRHDITVEPFALEIKRYSPATYQKRRVAIWGETVEQATRANKYPLLAVRLDRLGWQFTMCLADMAYIIERVEQGVRGADFVGDWMLGIDYTVTMPLEGFCYFSREYVGRYLEIG